MYKFKDILFSLREEYLKNEEKLKKLEEYVHTNGKRDVRFYLEKEDEEDLVELYYSISKRNNIIREAISKLLGIDYYHASGKMARTANGIYQPDTKSFYMMDDKREEVGSLVQDIFDNPFTNGSFNTVIENNEKDINLDRKLMIYPDRIITYKRIDTDYTSGVYDPKTDTFKFRNDKRQVTYDDMYNMLDLDFPADNLPPFLRVAIESSNTFGLNAYIYDNDANKKVKSFTPIVKEKRLVLKRQK